MTGRWLLRLHGAIGVALAWGAVWSATLGPSGGSTSSGPAASGFVFGLLLAIAESGKDAHAIPRSHLALWGVLASSVLPLVTGRYDEIPVLAPVGAAVAIATVSIARRSVRELLGPAWV